MSQASRSSETANSAGKTTSARRCFRIWAWLAGSVTLAALSGCAAELGEEPLGAHEDELLNGDTVASTSNPKTVALYHQSLCESDNTCCPTLGQMYWFPRPCSASVLRSLPGESWILTARHCVTVDGVINSPPLAPNQLRVNHLMSPGIAVPTPPTNGSVTPNLVIAPAAINDTAYDLALVRVPAAIPISNRRVSLPMNDKLNTNADLVAFGYGRLRDNLPAECEDGTSGAGTLRSARDFPVTGVCAGCGLWGTYTYFTKNADAQMIWRGDSGGPSFLQSTLTSPFFELVGVHGKSCMTLPGGGGCDGRDVRVAGAVAWIQSNLGGIYVSAHSNPGFNLAVSGTITNGARVVTQSVGDSVNTRWVYDRASQRIYVKNAAGTRYYLTAASVALGTTYRYVFVTSVSVGGGYQEWDLGLDRIWNHAPGPSGSECMRESPTREAEVGPCTGGTTRTWAWHTQP